MKLIGLYIENFGGLHRFTLDFEEGITAVIQPNGFGKTTLAEFIKAMFYSFPRKSKTLEKSLRQKYTPWDGGQFGGNLTFEYEGCRYRVERTFGMNPKGDTFAVIDLEANRKTNRFSEELGQELFGLDAESFERSTYLPQLRDSGSLATASIQAKLSNLVEDSTDVANFDKAMAALKTSRSALIPYRGSGGAVSETVAEITRLQLQLDMLREKEKQRMAFRQEAAWMQQKVGEIKEQQLQIGLQLQAAAQQEADILRLQQYTRLQNRYRQTRERLRFYEEKYPCGLPAEENLRRAEFAAERIKQYTDLAESAAVPTAAQLDGCRRLAREYGALQGRVHDLQQRKAELLQEERNCAAAISKMPPVLIFLGAAGMAAGGAAVLARKTAYGIMLLGAGALALVSGFAALCIQKGKQRSRKRAAEERQAQLQRLTDTAVAAAEKCRGEITAFFAGFGLNAEPQHSAAALEELERRRLRGMQYSSELGAAREELRQFFAAAGRPETADAIGELNRMREDLRAVQTAGALAGELKDQLALMEEACGDILLGEFSAVQDPRQLRQEEQRLQTELTAATTRLLQAQQKAQQLQEEVLQIPNVQESMEQARQRLAEQREKTEVLDAAIDFMLQARENLATSYMGTIRSRFGYYLSLLGGGDETYLVDTQLQVQLERRGQARELAYFSAGQTDLVMLCMRLSLADALFRGQEMFVILDDPFVNLDDTHTEQARQLLHKLASGRQILYLTCHSSRAI